MQSIPSRLGPRPASTSARLATTVLSMGILACGVPQALAQDVDTGHPESAGADDHEVERTRLFVLATPHLSSLKDDFRPELLDGLMDRLAALAPGVILVEALPGPSIVAMEEQGGPLDEVLASYSRRMTIPGRRAQEILGISWSEAYRQVSDLDRGCEDGAALERCILIYLAAYEYDSALLTFSTSPEPVRQAFRERYADITERFDRSLQSSNEYYTIALRLARSLGTERIHPVDAHREKGPLLAMLESDPTIEAFFERVFGDFSEHPFAREGKRRKEEAVEAGDLLPYYRWLNDPTTTQRDVDFQWTPFLEKDDESRFGKARLALWEQRNLLMAANIARVLAEYPGKTAVFIVGSGHKPFIDDYFGTASWVELLRADEVLGTADGSD